MKIKITRNLFLSISLLLTAFLSFGQVTNGNDSGPGSLREAIANANANPGPNTITIGLFVNPVLTSGPISITDELTISAFGKVKFS